MVLPAKYLPFPRHSERMVSNQKKLRTCHVLELKTRATTCPNYAGFYNFQQKEKVLEGLTDSCLFTLMSKVRYSFFVMVGNIVMYF